MCERFVTQQLITQEHQQSKIFSATENQRQKSFLSIRTSRACQPGNISLSFDSQRPQCTTAVAVQQSAESVLYLKGDEMGSACVVILPANTNLQYLKGLLKFKHQALMRRN